jgi:thioredoxin reductase (NADPH)
VALIAVAEYDVVVAGGGLAGLTAGLFSARCGRSTLVLAPDGPGGAIMSVPDIEDYPGFPEGVSGYELGPMVQEQAAAAGAAFEMAGIEELRPEGDAWVVGTAAGEATAGAVILATGARARRLGVPGEDDLDGHGISHCASCDGILFSERTVGVVGGGDAGLVEALELTKHVGEVIVFEREAQLTAQDAYRRRVLDHPSIRTRCSTVVEEVLGDGVVEGVRARSLATGEQVDVELSGLFVYIGREPHTRYLHGLLELDDSGRIPVDGSLQTRLPGLFAVGDIRVGAAGQAVTAAGDGATAALAADRHLGVRV